MRYWFLLGNHPELSAAEIAAVLHLTPTDWSVAWPFLILSRASLDTHALISKLGGTIKIAQELGVNKTPEQALDLIVNDLQKNYDGKIIFGLSVYSQTEKYSQVRQIKELGLKIKSLLKKQGHSARFAFNNEPTLSSVTVQKNNLIKKGGEYILVGDREITVLKTLVIQPFADWGVRDFGRPGRDSLSGMLPPKLARILINLLGVTDFTEKIIYDPFCGSGTILSEAISLGFTGVVGSDSSSKAITDTKANIDWLINNRHIGNLKKNFFVTEAQKISTKIKPNSIDAIITEPYLGQPLHGNESKEMLLKQVSQLENLYHLAILQMVKVLKPKASLIMIVPRFKHKNDWLTMSKEKIFGGSGLILETIYNSKLKKIDSMLYVRPDQKVGREIWKWRKM